MLYVCVWQCGNFGGEVFIICIMKGVFEGEGSGQDGGVLRTFEHI